MNGKIYEVLAAAKTRLAAQVPQLRVELYSGIFDEEALNRVLSRSGSVHLTFLAAANVAERVGGQLMLHAAFGAYVATTGNDRVLTGLNTIEAVAAALSIDDGGLGVPYTMPVIVGDMQNLYSKEVGDRGVAIYGLAFTVPILIGKAVFDGDLETYDPTQFVVESIFNGDETPLDPSDTVALEPAP